MEHRLHLRARKDLHRLRRPSTVLAGCAGLALLSGCQVDSFFDQSVVGRWEKTATSVPILERLTTIEDQNGEYVELTDVTPEDLIPAPREYHISPGDFMTVAMFDLIRQGSADPVQVQVDTRGVISLPIVGQVAVSGKTSEQAMIAVQEAMKPFVGPDPVATVEVVQQRQQTFTVLGSVSQPGPYFIPTADYRLLEGLTASGQFNDSIEQLYVIRQVPLSDQLKVKPANLVPDTGDQPGPAPTPPEPGTPDPKKLIPLIDELSKPQPKPPTDQAQPPVDLPKADEPAKPPVDLPKPADAPKIQAGAPSVMRSGRATPARRSDDPPPVDLVDSVNKPGPKAAPSAPPPGEQAAWMFLDGKWVPVGRREAPSSAGAKNDDMITQRVIRVPLKPLLAGDSKYNIIIRPGDIIRVPPPESGNIYIAGQVNRPGVYNLPAEGRLTLIRLVDAAGGLSGLGVPERVEITRMVGKNRQATIGLDLRAINEGTMPDIYMKPDDRVNVGTNFWAYPVAVLRSGFRATYGFGFVLDRNFDTEIFGTVPVDRGF